MVKLLIIGVTQHMPQNRVRATITYVTLNTINGVVVVKISFVKRTKQKAKHLDLFSTEGCKFGIRSHSQHRRKCLMDCFGGQLDENTRISIGYAQNLPNHLD
jgi:hypothetical protein